ncbi:endo/exonuclease/phosphatase domain-containing protein, partial [Haematococcus lacustris]
PFLHHSTVTSLEVTSTAPSFEPQCQGVISAALHATFMARRRNKQVPRETMLKAKLKRSFVRVVLPPADLAPCEPPPLRVLQWNVLADGLAQHGDFIKVPSAALEWETRLPLILDEIEEASADICAIQELNRYEELRALLALRGYDGCFFPKHVSPASRNRCPPDGLAIFYKKDRLEVAAQPAGTYLLDSRGRKMGHGFLQITLTDRLQGQQVVVVTTHLKAKEGQEMDNIRQSQVSSRGGRWSMAWAADCPH